jgi:hypothetical protein
MIKKTLLALSLFTTLSACTTGLQVDVASNNNFNPNQHSHYAWLAPAMMDETVREETIFSVDHLLRKQVNQQLQNKGYQWVDKANADFLVDYHYRQTIEADQGGIISPTNELAAAWEAPSDINETALYNHPVPAYLQTMHLEILLIAPNGELLWHARAQKILDTDMPDEHTLRPLIAEAVDEMLAQLPARR